MDCLDTFLDGIPSRELRLAIVGRPKIPTPKQKVEFIAIEGRHGSLTKVDTFQDIEFSIEYNLLEDDNIKPLLRKIRGYFFGKKKLQFSDDSVYFKIKNVEIEEIDNEIEEYGLFTVKFTCDPFQYEITRSIEIAKATGLMNYGTVESEPILKIFGSGDVSVSVNGDTFRITNLSDYVVINSELLESYRDDFSMNNFMLGDFPIFRVGKNYISWTGNITKIEIDCGWRYI